MAEREIVINEIQRLKARYTMGARHYCWGYILSQWGGIFVGAATTVMLLLSPTVDSKGLTPPAGGPPAGGQNASGSDKVVKPLPVGPYQIPLAVLAGVSAVLASINTLAKLEHKWRVCRKSRTSMEQLAVKASFPATPAEELATECKRVQDEHEKDILS